MSKKIRVCGIDMAIGNAGFAIAEIDIFTKEITVERVHLIQTERENHKSVRRSSDDLARCKEVTRFMHREILPGCVAAFCEVPSGAQSARASYLLGAATGVLSSITIPIIEVSPIETKVHSVGSKTASKKEIIDWAASKWPNAGWHIIHRNGANTLTGKNEHMADACAVIKAGVSLTAFDVQIAMLRAMAA